MRIVVINPNSSEDMTRDMDSVAQEYAQGRMEVVTLATPGAPPFIDTFEDKALAAPGMMQLVRQWEDKADAFVVACACDPNLRLLRELSSKPVIGMGEAAMQMAVMLGDSFSVLQTDSYSVPNKKRLVEEYGLTNHLASVRVADPAQGDRYHQYLEAGRLALAQDGAEVLVLGCAGLCDMTRRLSQELGAPVLDGVACGLALAESLVRLGQTTSKVRYYSGGKNG